MNHKNTRISALLPVSLVAELKKIAIEKKITQSLVVQKALEFFVENKLDQDTRELAKIDFDDLPSEDEWLNIQSSI